VQGLKLIHVCLLGGPADTKTLLLIRLRDLQLSQHRVPKVDYGGWRLFQIRKVVLSTQKLS
jgi:hypothetical protein